MGVTFGQPLLLLSAYLRLCHAFHQKHDKATDRILSYYQYQVISFMGLNAI